MKMCKSERIRRKYWKCAAAILLSVMTAAGMLSGCGKGKGGEENGGETAAKGRYVEESIELPAQEGEEVLNMEESEQGDIVLYTMQADGQVFRYEYKDGQWEQTTLDWISQLFGGREIYMQEVHEHDGTQVAWGVDTEMTHVARSSDGQTGEELAIPYLAQQGEYGYPLITQVQIDSDGRYWLNNIFDSKVAVIDPDSLESISEINTANSTSSEQKMMFPAKNGDIAVNTEDDTFTIYGTDLEEKETFETIQQGAWMCNDDKNWYLVSREGIVRIAPGNETSEVLMDGSMGEMSSSLSYVAGFEMGEDNDFYVLYRQGKTGTASLVHYVYDAEALAVPEHVLRVFALEENQTVQDAILSFQKAHPDVKVEFTTSGKEEGITMDDIRTLNTELLSGNGADILLLDGLLTDTYIEKGILADLTGLTDELLSGDKYLEPVLKNAAQKDGKIYGMPVKFSIPIIYGDEQAKAAFDSLDSLSAYVEAHPDKSIVGVAEKKYIRDFLFQMYQDEIIGEDGKADQEKLAKLLETELKIAANARTEAFDEDNVNEWGAEMTSQIFHQGVFNNAGSAAIINHPDTVSTDRISSVADMMIPYTIMRQMSLTPDTLNDFYIPQGIVGINQSTEQKKLAEEFVKYLFAKEIQEKPLDDGLPVLESALDRLKEEVKSEYAQSLGVTSSWTIDGEETINIEAGYPTEEEVADLTDRCHTLGKPATQDCVIWNIYQTEADACLKGSIDSGTAAGNIARKVDTYLAE